MHKSFGGDLWLFLLQGKFLGGSRTPLLLNQDYIGCAKSQITGQCVVVLLSHFSQEI